MESTPPSSMAGGDANNNNKLHIVMLPWLAFGHMIPYLELSKLIAEKGHKVSFLSTPRNIDRLPKLPPNLSPLIDFVKLPLPHLPDLPENAEATSDLPYNKVKYLKLAYDALQQPFTEFLQKSSPDWVFYDFIPYWVGPIASKLGISSAFFSIFIAAFCGFLGSPSDLMGGDKRNKPEDFVVPPPWVSFRSSVAFRLFEILRMFNQSVAGDEENVSDLFRFGASIEGCDVFAVRSCSEFEPEWLQLLEGIYRKPVVPVGQLPTTAYDSGGGDDDIDDSWWGIKQWLDRQIEGSVVYVAFGSEAKPSQLELTEIALGLELSGLPFFWVLRKQRGVADTELTQLPDGFEERTKERGVVCTSWVPQLKILSHDSVGGFLTHSGWSSVVEAIQFERALILLTFMADQGLNARVLEEKRMGYSVPRNDLDGSFMRDSVADSLRLVMVEEEGMIYKLKVKEMKGVFFDRNRQHQYVDNLLGCLQSSRTQKRAI